MPCTSIVVRLRVKLDGKNVNKDALIQALKMMKALVQDVQFDEKANALLVKTTQGNATIFLGENMVVQGNGAYAINEKIVKYYQAVVQAKLLQKQGYSNVTMQEQGDKLRIHATR